MNKVVWFCYASVTESGELKSAAWIVSAAKRLLAEGKELILIAPAADDQTEKPIKTKDGCKLFFVSERKNQTGKIDKQLVAQIFRLLTKLQPDVFQIFGTELNSYLCAGLAAQEAKLLDRTIIWIQGLCAGVGACYCDGLPAWEIHRMTFRDLLRADNIHMQKKKFLKKAENEQKLLNLVKHAIGRTQWDKDIVTQIAPKIHYHHCSELLRPEFYCNTWQIDNCDKHRIFMCQSDYPIKGLHILLKALPMVLQKYPDTKVYISGDNLLQEDSLRKKLARPSYAVYLRKLIHQNNLEKVVVFTGYLTAKEMVEQYQKSRLYVLPSMVENSPNSLGEAMLMGVPCVAADTGGIPSMMTSGTEGLLYPKINANALAEEIIKLFSDDGLAETLGNQARRRALITHDPETGMEKLLKIYNEIGGKVYVPQCN